MSGAAYLAAKWGERPTAPLCHFISHHSFSPITLTAAVYELPNIPGSVLRKISFSVLPAFKFPLT